MGMRSSSKPSTLAQFSGFGKQEGTAKVVGARFKVIQHSKGEASGGGLTTPFLALQLDEVYVDPSTMNPVDPALQPEQVNFPVCWGNKDSLEATLRFWPANGKTADDPDLEDVGVSDIDGEAKLKLVEIDSEGNTLVSVDGIEPYANSEYGVFVSGLGKLAFKDEVLAKSFAPDLVGLVYEFKTSEKKVVFEKLGIKYQASNRKDKKGNPVPDVCREIVKIHVRPYEKGASKGAIKGATAGAAKPGTNGAAKAAEDQASNPALEAATQAAITALAGQTLTKSKFQGAVGLALCKNETLGKDRTKIGNGFTNAFKKLDEDGLTMMGMQFGFTVDGDQVTVNDAE